MQRGAYYQHLFIVRDAGGLQAAAAHGALSCLTQDRANVLPSYQQFVSQLHDKACASPASPDMPVTDAQCSFPLNPNLTLGKHRSSPHTPMSFRKGLNATTPAHHGRLQPAKL